MQKKIEKWPNFRKPLDEEHNCESTTKTNKEDFTEITTKQCKTGNQMNQSLRMMRTSAMRTLRRYVRSNQNEEGGLG
jgi:hypothetical protein